MLHTDVYVQRLTYTVESGHPVQQRLSEYGQGTSTETTLCTIYSNTITRNSKPRKGAKPKKGAESNLASCGCGGFLGRLFSNP